MSMAAAPYPFKPQPYPNNMGGGQNNNNNNNNFLGSPVTQYSTTPPMSPISPQSTQSSITGYYSNNQAMPRGRSNTYDSSYVDSSSSSGGGGRVEFDYSSSNNIVVDHYIPQRSPSYEDEMNQYQFNQRALELFEETIANEENTSHQQQQQSCPSPSSIYSNNNAENVESKLVNRGREQQAKNHALSLLDKHVGVKTQVVKTGAHRQMIMHTNPTKHAPKLSGAALMTTTVPKTSSSSTRDGGNENSLNSTSLQARSRASPRSRHRNVPLGVHPLALLQNKEDMATTTRKPKPKTADDVRDPETISGMKCRLDWDREKDARNRALALLRKGFMD